MLTHTKKKRSTSFPSELKKYSHTSGLHHNNKPVFNFLLLYQKTIALIQTYRAATQEGSSLAQNWRRFIIITTSHRSAVEHLYYPHNKQFEKKTLTSNLDCVTPVAVKHTKKKNDHISQIVP